jgi:hypothetical protein
VQKQRKTKYQIAKTEQRSQKLNKYLLEVIRLCQNTKQFAETERKYQIAETEGKMKYQIW